MKRQLYSALCLLIPVGAAWSQVAVELELEHRKFFQRERALAFVTLSNLGFESFKLPSGTKNPSSVDVYVTRFNRDPVERISNDPIVKRFNILPREKRRFMVDLSRSFEIQRMGGYMVHAEVSRDGLVYTSELLFFDVVGGLPLGNARYPVPGLSGALRSYNLFYLPREGHETLFLSVSEEPSRKRFHAISLGWLVRVYSPKISIGRGGEIEISHQSSPKRITRSILRSDKAGLALIDQKYEQIKGYVGADGTWTTE